VINSTLDSTEFHCSLGRGETAERTRESDKATVSQTSGGMGSMAQNQPSATPTPKTAHDDQPDLEVPFFGQISNVLVHNHHLTVGTRSCGVGEVS
jgi:hypothetical protein